MKISQVLIVVQIPLAHPAVDLCVTKTGGGQVQRSFSCPWPGAGYPRVVFRIRVVQPDHPERAALAAGPFTRPRRTAIRQARSEGDLPEPGGGEGSDCRQVRLFPSFRRQIPEYRILTTVPPRNHPFLSSGNGF